MQIIDDSNYLQFAAHYYDSRFINNEEFVEDLKRIVYIKRLFNTYNERGDLKERLILNHLIILFNMFGSGTCKMLFFKLEGYESILKTFLTFIDKMPNQITGIGNPPRLINNSEISLDPIVWQKLMVV